MAAFLTLILAFPTLQIAHFIKIFYKISLEYYDKADLKFSYINSIKIRLSILTSGSCLLSDKETIIFIIIGKNLMIPSLQFLIIISNLYLNQISVPF